jgi:hypothetical protein
MALLGGSQTVPRPRRIAKREPDASPGHLGGGERARRPHLGTAPQVIYCEPDAECTVYVFMPNGFDFKPAM